MKSSDELQIDALMERYFEGLYHSDSEILRTVFHPELAYVNATDGNHEFMDLETYMTRIDNREPPAKRGDPRRESVDRMTMMGRDYQDLLTLIHTDDGWKVITKVFAYRAKED